MYHPFLQAPWPFMAMTVRGSIEPSQLSGPVRSSILEVDLEQPVFDVKPMSQVVSESINEPRLITVLLSIFAAMAIILAAAGIYGVMSYLVDQRRQVTSRRVAEEPDPARRGARQRLMAAEPTERLEEVRTRIRDRGVPVHRHRPAPRMLGQAELVRRKPADRGEPP